MDTECGFKMFRGFLRGKRTDAETVVFGLLVLASLFPVWGFHYLPTEDGPSHLFNAFVLKDYNSTQTRYHEFFELRPEPVPNWTSYALLVCLLYLFPPLVAEKVLVSLYIVGYSFSVRYFLGSFGEGTRRLAPVALLFLFNRCFLLGFYNYCLSLVVYWTILGYCLRRLQGFGLIQALLLAALFLLACFTHLVGYVAAVGSVILIFATEPGRRWGRLGYACASALPSGWLAAAYLRWTGFFGSREASDLTGSWLRGSASRDGLWSGLESAHQHLFVPLNNFGTWLAPAALVLFQLLIAATVWTSSELGGGTPPIVRRWPLLLLGLSVAVLYFLVPDHFGQHGGFLKARLALLPCVLWLACLRLPATGEARFVLTGLVCALVGLNTLSVTSFFKGANDDLAAVTAGMNSAGRDHTLVLYRTAREPSPIGYLSHASAYYCLGTGNIDLDNYEARMFHFPVRYGRYVPPTSKSDLLRSEAVDIVLIWYGHGSVPEAGADPAETISGKEGSHVKIYDNGRLKVFRAKRLTFGRDSPEE